MIKVYRKTATIKAEQFDGSNEMVDKYELIDAGTMLGTHHSPELYLTGSGKVYVGDWIATGINGKHWLITEGVFKKEYAELPVIPKDWADMIEEYKANHCRLEKIFTDALILNYDEQDVVARAWLDGYQVEEDK
ncbi:DUF1642 domain-containing protein [Lactiplantibacillus plantarum]|uniref:DUF1642 domain-containing protein n=1 Tax=Lactiplantibacillus plantarum TaxID=1590 RepID=UPI0023083478|nr:DUF1642 domain-containing protein [Lactiplantibacillus plantarum]WCE42330.1 hypothetical protein PGB25_08955 [Lactiplantibacillus plantarum]WCE44341.1 hypothetical protein PGB25_04625 [Lactiplantibacillus plantarum]WCE44521.1 hypothetical protein PGB25_05680 [Lactiplantibacillus plantarum]